jgi:hypothetical protein
LNGETTNAIENKQWKTIQREAIQFNYKILVEIFSSNNDASSRISALKCRFLERIFERLGALSGEKPRHLEESSEEEVVEDAPSL